MRLQVSHLSKSFGSFAALSDVNLDVADRELIALLGPSGSGKTTLLRIIAGLEFADPGAGSLLFDGQDVSQRPVGERNIGFVFQQYALFRHMTVFENIAFGLRVRRRSNRPPEAEIRKRVGDLIDLMQLPGLDRRYQMQLSGGQRQRVAFARALAIQPRLLLLDEPFGALDAKVRKELRRWLRGVQETVGVTTILVTHDQEEALEVADRVVVMNKGRIEQAGTPQEVYDRPATPFVFEFLGDVNRLQVPPPKTGARPEPLSHTRPLVAYVRRHNVIIHRAAGEPATIEAEVRRVHTAGPLARVELTRSDSGDAIEAELTRREADQFDLHPGERVFLELRNLQTAVTKEAPSGPESWSI